MATRYWLGTTTDPSLSTNWSGSTTPVSSDDVVITAIPGTTLANIAANNMSAVVLNSLRIDQSYTGTIGAAGAGGYWQIGTATLNIGLPSGDGVNSGGSGRIKLDIGTGSATINVYNSGNTTDTGQEPIRLLAVNSGNVLNVLGGRVGLATNVPGEVSTIGTLNCSGLNAVCNMGPGVTWTTANAGAGGKIMTYSGGTTVTIGSGSTATCYGSSAITTFNNGGTLLHNLRTGTMTTTLNNYAGATADFSGNPATVTVTTLNRYKGSTVKVSPAAPTHVTFTNRPLQGCGTETVS